jgi:hypothetical protein
LETNQYFRHYGRISVPLSECSWEFRVTHQDTGALVWTFRARPAILVRFRCPFALRLLTIIVIDDATAMQRWGAFLRLADVPHWEHRKVVQT